MKLRQRRAQEFSTNVSNSSTECPRRVLKATTSVSNLCDIRVALVISITLLILYLQLSDDSNSSNISNKNDLAKQLKSYGISSKSADNPTDNGSGVMDENSRSRSSHVYVQAIQNQVNTDKWFEDYQQKQVLPLIPKLGNYHRKIITSNELTQGYFDQAMIITFAFNHDEAIRSLKYAIKYDPNCAMCHWAIAHNHALNINRVPTEHRIDEAIEHAWKAKTISNNPKYKQDELSQGLIDAMIIRFPKTRTIQDEHVPYCEEYMDMLAMLVVKFPNDVDLLAMYAESIMNTMPWNYYEKDRETAKPKTKIVYKILERGLEINPNHLLVLHLYIHIHEASLTMVHSNRLEDIADRLDKLMQRNKDNIHNMHMGIGHLIHMPSHVYIRVGRFEDSIKNNLAAIDMAETYFEYYNITNNGWNMYYRDLYYCHRETFVVYSAMMNGRKSLAINMQNKLLDNCMYSLLNFPYFYEDATWMQKILLKFGDFEKVVQMNEKNDRDNPKDVKGYGTAQFHFAQAFAWVSLGQCTQGKDIYDNKFLPLATDERLRANTLFWESAARLYDVASHTFLARYYDRCKNDFDKSKKEWEITAVLNMELVYMEPPFWPLNPRACQGQILLDRGEYEEAENVFRQDLKEFEKNGWGLKGLELALKGQGKYKDASEITEEFNQIWEFSQVGLDRACY